MEVNKDAQAIFMEAISGLKEYARVNGEEVTKEDVTSYFKGIELDASKLQMVYGYLMANNIKVRGEAQEDNSFLSMLESAAANDNKEYAEPAGLNDDALSAGQGSTQTDKEAGVQAGEEAYGQICKGTEEQTGGEASQSGKETEAQTNSQSGTSDRTIAHMNKASDYEEDEKYLSLYIEDISKVEKLSEVSRAYLLMNIVEDNDKESLKLLSESYLEKVVDWTEPFRHQGVLSSDLIQEGNLAMMAYVSEKRFANNYEWREKIKEGSTEDLLQVMEAIDEDVRSEVEGSIRVMIDEQNASEQVTDKVLNKVNLVNDWAKRLKEELGRKPTVQEVADKIGISADNIREAIQLSADNIEDIQQ